MLENQGLNCGNGFAFYQSFPGKTIKGKMEWCSAKSKGLKQC